MAWIFDTLSWAVGAEHQYIFYAADLFTALQVKYFAIRLLKHIFGLEYTYLIFNVFIFFRECSFAL